MPDTSIQIPQFLTDWTLDRVTALVRANVYEGGFDWKEVVPRDDNGKARLRETAAALANGGGGFIVFGVRDQRGEPWERRLCGVDQAADIANTVAQILKHADADPPVPHQFGVPQPLSGDPSRAVVTMQVLKIAAPHAVKGTFPVRFGEGTKPMTTHQVRLQVLQADARETKLRLLLGEVKAARDALRKVASCIVPGRIEAAFLSSLLAEVYPILADRPDLLVGIAKLRRDASYMNTHLDYAFAAVFPNGGNDVRNTQQFKTLVSWAENAQTEAAQVCQDLENHIAEPRGPRA